MEAVVSYLSTTLNSTTSADMAVLNTPSDRSAASPELPQLSESISQPSTGQAQASTQETSTSARDITRVLSTPSSRDRSSTVATNLPPTRRHRSQSIYTIYSASLSVYPGTDMRDAEFIPPPQMADGGNAGTDSDSASLYPIDREGPCPNIHIYQLMAKRGYFDLDPFFDSDQDLRLDAAYERAMEALDRQEEWEMMKEREKEKR